MKFSYQKLENYNKRVSQQKRHFKFFLGAVCYVSFFLFFDFTPFKSNDKGSGLFRSKFDGKAPLEHFAVWTYPLPPPKDNLDQALNEKLYCSYAPCAPPNENVYFYLEPYLLNLGLFDEVSEKFNTFVRHNAWYKILHGANFPHHVQSVAIISIIRSHPNACARTLGEDKSTDVCSSDTNAFKDYDPTDANSVPPFAVQFMDMPDKYGILDYTSFTQEVKQSTLSHEMQSLASLQFLPYLTDLVDTTRGIPGFEGHLLLNGWFGGDIAFPPNEKASITMTSMQIDQGTGPIVHNHMDFFKTYNANVGPIGVIDSDSLSYLRSLGLSAILSSSLTSTMTLANLDQKRDSKGRASVLVVDYYDDLVPGLIPDKIMDRATHVKSTETWDMDSQTRFKRSFDLMKQIAEADVVICFTSQIAFIAMANGASTILVGDIRKMETQARGNGHLFHRQEPKNKWHFDVDDMKPNPGVHVFDRYRASFLQLLKQRSLMYYDTANLFGMIPLQRVGKDIELEHEYEQKESFQFVITTAPNTITWQMMRAIESVFYFHPNAKVVVHSNTIPQRESMLDIFAEAGYDFEVRPYSFEELFEDASFIDDEMKGYFLENLEVQRKQQYWYTHEADLVKMLILEQTGGVMMDTDMHLIKAVPKSFVNVGAWKDEEDERIGTAVLIFEKNNPFLRVMLADAIDIANNHYNRDWYDIFGMDLLTEHYTTTQKGTSHFKVLTHEVFYPYKNEIDCLTNTNNRVNPIDDKFTFGVHMSSKGSEDIDQPLPGSHCFELIQSHCIFCAETGIVRTETNDLNQHFS